MEHLTIDCVAKNDASKNKSFVLRIDAGTLSAVEAWAADEFRSTNGQIQWILADALRRYGRKKNMTQLKQENSEK